MTQINWLHLTDLHIGGREAHLLPAIKNAFRDDLKKLHEKSGPWDLVVFTGDLTQRASVAEFALLDRFLDELWGWLTELGSKPALVTVPGNHDLVRPDPNDPAVILLGEWAAKDKVRDQFWSNQESLYRKVVDAAFANYAQWWAKTPHKLPGRSGLVPGDFSSVFEKDGASIGIVGLNSSYLQLTDENALGKLALSSRQFHAVCDGDGPAWVRRHNANLLLTHHPPSWLGEDARGELRSDIASGSFFALHLFGHMHEARYEEQSVGGAPISRVSQGTSLFGLEYFENKYERRHGYAAGRIELGEDKGLLTIWPRNAQKPGGEWNFAPAVADFVLEQDAMAPRDVSLHRRFVRPLAMRPAVTAPLPNAPESRRWAVVVGINSYNFGRLQYCADDAKEIASVFRKDLGFEHVYEIHEDAEVQPKHDAIFQQLIEIRDSEKVRPDDFFVFYFSGHGVNEKGKDYLLPINASFRDAATLGVSLERLCTQLESIGCKNTALVIDACRETTQGAKGATTSIGDSSRQLLTDSRIIAFFSCGPQDRSYEIDDLKHGTFTYCLLQAIERGEATTVAQLEEYLKENVPLINRKYGKPAQQPYAVFAPADRGELKLLARSAPLSSASSRFEALTDRLIEAAQAHEGVDLSGPLQFLALMEGRSQPNAAENQKLAMIERFFTDVPGKAEIATFLKYWSRTLSKRDPGPRETVPIKKPSGLNRAAARYDTDRPA